MKKRDARGVVEALRRDTRLYLPALSAERGFSSSRVEHLLNGLVREMPVDECYLEVGTLEGRTLNAAASGNVDKTLYACDPESKYHTRPERIPDNVRFIQAPWQSALHLLKKPLGLVFYDADHSMIATWEFMLNIQKHLAPEAIAVLDDWDRESVRMAMMDMPGWELVAELPEYGDGLTCPPNHFGYYFGISIWSRNAR